ncbi:hypothetical protein EVAR_17887_1 [Eumeta japonica]|uniref:Uncharacterized protein n=1 Tax=Eumeta variegata TaxID=151549 RepID=A0A4C1UYU3_EUMVA|nr:hypothetical protein EVAR_17887_1 [Eumeta japonica]
MKTPPNLLFSGQVVNIAVYEVACIEDAIDIRVFLGSRMVVNFAGSRIDVAKGVNVGSAPRAGVGGTHPPHVTVLGEAMVAIPVARLHNDARSFRRLDKCDGV